MREEPDLEEVVPKGLCWLPWEPTLTYGYILLLLAAAVAAVVSDVTGLLLLDTQVSLNREKLSLPLYFGNCHDPRGNKIIFFRKTRSFFSFFFIPIYFSNGQFSWLGQFEFMLLYP